MRLKVTGIETIEITDPGRLIRRRKEIDPQILRELKGQVLTADELKGHFGYARTTALSDTQLKRHVEAVIVHRHTRWRVL